MLKIKVCGLRERENVENLLDLDIDYAGFIFYEKSPRYVADFNNLKGFDFRNTKKVGVFVNKNPNEIVDLHKSFPFECVQLHGHETPGECMQLKEYGLKVMKAFSVDGAFNFEVLKPYNETCDFYLFDTKTPLHGGSGEKFNWRILENHRLDKPFFLSGGINQEDATDILQIKHPMLYAVDINSRFEVSPGLKDVGKVKGFIEQIRNYNVVNQ